MKSISLKVLAVAAMALVGAGMAHAGAATGDATLPEQIIQELSLTDQLAQEANTASNSFKNLTNGFSGANALQSWQVGQITTELNNLVKIIAQAQGVSYTSQNVAQQVKTTYGDPTQAIGNYQKQVATWTANTNSQIAQVLQQYGVNANDFQTQQQALNTIQQHSQTASGAMDLLQAGNQISGMMVSQIQKLQSDVQAGNQLLANYIGQETNMQAHKTDGLQNWLSGKSITGTTTSGSTTGTTGTTATTGTATTGATGSTATTGSGTTTTGTTAATGSGTTATGTTATSGTTGSTTSSSTGTTSTASSACDVAAFSPGVRVPPGCETTGTTTTTTPTTNSSTTPVSTSSSSTTATSTSTDTASSACDVAAFSPGVPPGCDP